MEHIKLKKKHLIHVKIFRQILLTYTTERPLNTNSFTGSKTRTSHKLIHSR